ncbi:MAG: toll/interleukin-1 receptor domain-containing protein, partial [Anaerolineae bacterium]|nr:toll/interleukin-1 receptor domain-containing protein [Anaerolineae bacterium]
MQHRIVFGLESFYGGLTGIMIGQIYISYCSGDRAATAAVRRQLERRGYAVCLRDADIPPVKDAVHPITT